MAINLFLKIDGIDGESNDAKHKNEIDVFSFSWGLTQPRSETGGGGGAGKVSFQDFHFIQRVNKASPKLFLSCASGKHIKTALLTVRKAGEKQVEFLKIKLTDILVSSFQSGAGGEDIPMEQVSLNFARIEFEYGPQKADGSLAASVKAGWDLKANKSV